MNVFDEDRLLFTFCSSPSVSERLKVFLKFDSLLTFLLIFCVWLACTRPCSLMPFLNGDWRDVLISYNWHAPSIYEYDSSLWEQRWKQFCALMTLSWIPLWPFSRTNLRKTSEDDTKKKWNKRFLTFAAACPFRSSTWYSNQSRQL